MYCELQRLSPTSSASRTLAPFFGKAWGLGFSLQSCLPGCSNCSSLCCNPESSGVGSPEFSLLLGTAPHPPPTQLSQAGLMRVGQAHPRISQTPGLFPAQYSWEGSVTEEGGQTILLHRPCCLSLGSQPLGLEPGDRKGLCLSRLATAVVNSKPSLLTPLPSLSLVKVLGGNSLSRKSGNTGLPSPK